MPKKHHDFSENWWKDSHFGVIHFSPQDDSVVITFVTQKPPKIMTLFIHERASLENFLPYQLSVQDELSVTLINTWHTRRSAHDIIKYSLAADEAIQLHSDMPISDNDFKEILDFSYFNKLAYSRERIFCTTIEKQGLDKAKLLASISKNDLARVVNCRELAIVLKYLSVEQILRTGNAALDLQNIKAYDVLSQNFSENTGGGTCSVSSGEIKYEEKLISFCKRDWEFDARIGFKSHIHATYQANKSKVPIKFTLESGPVLTENVVCSHKNIENFPLLELVNNWYLVENKYDLKTKSTTTIRYSPKLHHYIREELATNFPIKEFIKDKFYIFKESSLYYQEVAFVEWLAHKGYALHTVKLLPGMTHEKLEILSALPKAIEACLTLGITIVDLAKVETVRLAYILSHFEEAKKALEFVDIYELFSLKKPAQISAFTLFYTKPREDNNHHSPCFIL